MSIVNSLFVVNQFAQFGGLTTQVYEQKTTVINSPIFVNIKPPLDELAQPPQNDDSVNVLNTFVADGGPRRSLDANKNVNDNSPNSFSATRDGQPNLTRAQSTTTVRQLVTTETTINESSPVPKSGFRFDITRKLITRVNQQDTQVGIQTNIKVADASTGGTKASLVR